MEAESEGELDIGTVEVPHLDTVREIVGDVDIVLGAEFVFEVDSVGLLVPDDDAEEDALTDSDAGTDCVDKADMLTSPVATVGVHVAEYSEADAETVVCHATDCEICVDMVLKGDADDVLVADADFVTLDEPEIV